MKKAPSRLWIIIPCYNEETVLPITCELFLNELKDLIQKKKISDDSKILFVNDGSRDTTWKIITELSKNGYEVVYGVRNKRKTDTFFKRFTAESFYKVLKSMGAEVVFNHADYRLISARVLKEFAEFKEVNLFLRGLIPLVGFKSTSVYYERHERMAGESHYPLSKMLALAFDGITSLSVKPIQMIMMFGCFVAVLSFIGAIWAVVSSLMGNTVPGWTRMTCIICFVSGIQLISLGIIGNYIGKIYMEVKHRPRYIISERTWEQDK